MAELRTHSNQVRTASGLNILAGLWLVISPWIYGYFASEGSVWNNIIVGLVIAAFAAIRFFKGGGTQWLSWANAVLGAWMFISPWVYGYTANVGRFWNSLIVGAIVVALAIWSAVADRTGVRRTTAGPYATGARA